MLGPLEDVAFIDLIVGFFAIVAWIVAKWRGGDGRDFSDRADGVTVKPPRRGGRPAGPAG
jgi:hypothetical protein